MLNKSRIYITIIAIFIVSTSAISQDYRSNRQMSNYTFAKIKEINRAIQEQNYPKQIKLIDKFHETYGGNPMTIYRRGFVSYLMNDIKTAKEFFNQAYGKGDARVDSLVNFFLVEKSMAEVLSEAYTSNYILDSLNGYRILPTRSDSLQGGWREERTCFDVYYYDLKLRVDPIKRDIKGQSIIHFNLVKNTHVIQIDLFKNFTINSINWNGKQLSYKRDCNAIFIEFPIELKKTEQHSIEIKYEGIPIEAINPPWNAGFVWDEKGGKPWVGVCCEHLGASSWWPNKDHLSDKADSIRFNIEVPNNLVAVSNGQLRSISDIDEGFKSYEWIVNYPVVNYNLTFYLGDYTNISDSIPSNNLKIDYYVWSTNVKKAKKYYSQTSEIVEVFEKLFGEYSFIKDGLGYIEAPYKGMEHQGAIAMGSDYKNSNSREYPNNDYCYLLIHETAHEWWGNSVSINDMSDAWLNEAFATYSEALFIEEKYGYDEYIKVISTLMKGINNLWPLVGDRKINQNTFIGTDIYGKGALLLHTLRCILDDDELFIKIIKDYYNTYKYKTINTNEFINFFHSYTENDYTPIFNQYLYRSKPPILKYYYTKLDTVYNFVYKWDNVDEDFEMPFSIFLDEKTNLHFTATTNFQSAIIPNFKFISFPCAYIYPIKTVKNAYTYFWNEKLDLIPVKSFYNNSDQIKEKGKLIANIKVGEWKEYYETGVLKNITYYLNGYKDGLYQVFSRERDTLFVMNFKKDTLQGEFKCFSKGNLVEFGIYKDGKKSGKWKYYYLDGIKQCEGMYHNNAKTGKWVFYNPEGIIVTECVYNEGNDGYDLYNRLGEKISEDSIGKTCESRVET